MRFLHGGSQLLDQSTTDTDNTPMSYSHDTNASSTPPTSDMSPGAYGSDFATSSAADTFANMDPSLGPGMIESDEYHSPVFSVFSAGNNILEAGDGGMFDPSLGTDNGGGNHFDFRGSAFDWLDFDVSDVALAMDGINVGVGVGVDVGVGVGVPGNAPTSGPVFQELLPGSEPMPPVSDAPPPPPQLLGPAPPAPPHIPVPAPAPSLPPLPRPSVLPWPFEQGQEAPSDRYPLPPLRDVLQNSVRLNSSSGGAKTTELEGLFRLLSNQHLPGPEELVDSNMSMGLDLLQRLLNVYFSDFQIIQPIIHLPTWSIPTSPPVLLAAMACIGAVLSSEPNAAELAATISDFCLPMITWLGVTDTANYSNPLYLAALCLHQIYSLGSGNRQLYQNADRTRGVLIGSLRGLGLLTSRPNPNSQEDSDVHRPPSTDLAILQAEWLAWAAQERDVRIAWASFEYDCSLCTLTSRRGAVDLSELPSRLPCIDSVWEAPSASAWAALKSRLPPSALGAPLSGVISAAIAGKPPPRHVSVWGKRLCGQAVGRLLWDLKQLEAIATNECFGVPSLFTSHQQSKLSLLRGLDCMAESMNHPISTADLVSYNISSLLCHYSHLYTAEDTMDTVLYIVRNVVSRGSRPNKGLEVARCRLVSALTKDPHRARRLVWHAGQIVAVANEYLVAAPCEIMRLFMSYIFITAFAKYCPRPHRSSRGGTAATTTTARIVRLDIPNHDSNQSQAVSEWIQRGGPARIGSAENIYSDGATLAITQDAQSMLQRLQSWGLAEKFSKILQVFEINDGDEQSKRGE
ncbi:hypothetical protein SAPIO_CDS2284 [Scedosporium apiospermum]|uniref:Xylanolytic transcriptional activator regulatory domain-containing protein n=1 Tax=Pseudallescheria apiosperma TaxID=563466 RepID=A0A084GC60_PSEDA|nr:uncharacterized protein SAPIO_CDS2284 [Scedosporium apiospermum]KEZ44922.1 hypothetical protein SAPIO_CDS2284 [Scedosporium apiospermum]